MAVDDVTRVANGVPMDLFVRVIRERVARLGPEPLLVFDIGSRDGQDARALRAMLGLETYAFEAHPQEYELHRHANQGIVHWINAAIYDRSGSVTFYPKALGSGIHSIRDRGSEFGVGEIEVPCQTMASFLRERQLEGCSYVVKVDVEGCSLEVLRSFEALIERVVCFHMESEEEAYFKDQHLQSEVFAYLEDCGFVMVMYSTTEGSNQHDSVWIAKKHLSD